MNRAERRDAAKESRRIDTLVRHGFDIVRNPINGKKTKELVFRSYFTKRRKK